MQVRTPHLRLIACGIALAALAALAGCTRRAPPDPHPSWQTYTRTLDGGTFSVRHPPEWTPDLERTALVFGDSGLMDFEGIPMEIGADVLSETRVVLGGLAFRRKTFGDASNGRIGLIAYGQEKDPQGRAAPFPYGLVTASMPSGGDGSAVRLVDEVMATLTFTPSPAL